MDNLMLLIFVLCAYEVALSKLPTASFTDEESMNTRDLFQSYMPAEYGNFGFFTNWVDSLARLLPNYQAPLQTSYSPYSTDYSQDQWISTPSQRSWNHDNNYQHQNQFPNYGESQWLNTPYDYHGNQSYDQPKITKKISTLFTDDSSEIKHKVIISPEHPDGTGYISITKPGANTSSSSKDGKVYYRF